MVNSSTLVIGAAGQVGSELTLQLRQKHGSEKIIAADIKLPGEEVKDSGPFEELDVLEKDRFDDLIKKYKVTEIYNLAALLSASAEEKPMFGWQLNMDGLLNTLVLARENKIEKVFWPSSIAVFGPSTPKENTPQTTVMDPNTVYGISKLAGERWCEYFFEKFGVDTRSIRYPGLISYKTEPGGGTTDYAVDIFHHALEKNSYQCFLSKNTYLPMLYMPDAVRGTIELMEAPKDRIKIRSSYNLSGFSIAPKDLEKAIQYYKPDFQVSYRPDFRQDIANGWPEAINDSQARKDWNWEPKFTLDSMVRDMLENLQKQLA